MLQKVAVLFVVVAGVLAAQVPGHDMGAASRSDRGSRTDSRGATPARDAAAPGDAASAGESADKDKKPRRGIPVTSELVVQKCNACHLQNEDGLMGRISYMRKTPEGWELSLKRMIRLQDVKVTPEEARSIVGYLSNSHGLTRREAERANYETERRVHWSEEGQDSEFRQTCAACHTLGRVLSEQRDLDEWKYLKATHLAMFPLVDWQAFRSQNDRGGAGGNGPDLSTMSEADIEEFFTRRREAANRGPDRADGIMAKLAKSQPLFTKEWDDWQVSRREVPLAGAWSVVGHEVSRGDVRGRVTVTRTAEDAYETAWELRYADGSVVMRTGKGVLYAGYSWRGRSSMAGAGGDALREALLLSEDWNTMSGRFFSGGYNELGIEVSLYRDTGVTQVLAADHGALMVPSTAHVIDVFGQAFPAALTTADFFIGTGVTVTKVERESADRVRLTVDVARNAERGPRHLAFRASPGPQVIVLYDTIDYIKILPEEGFSRVGGDKHPKQMERFEAVAMNRGPDNKPYTADDYQVMPLDVKWALEEFPVRENDDDLQYVGALDPATGVFTPALDGPNPKRKFHGNNIGDVYVVATCTLHVQVMPEKPESRPGDAASRPGTGPASNPASRAVGGTASQPASKPASRPATRPLLPGTVAMPTGPVVMVDKLFRARGHLLVTVPLYVRFDRYEWDRR